MLFNLIYSHKFIYLLYIHMKLSYIEMFDSFFDYFYSSLRYVSVKWMRLRWKS